GTTAINGGVVNTSGAQSYGDNVTLGADTSLTAVTGNFHGTLTGGTHTLSITGDAVFGDGVGSDAVTGLTTLSVSGATTVNTDTITSSGGQSYTGAVTLG